MNIYEAFRQLLVRFDSIKNKYLEILVLKIFETFGQISVKFY